MGLLSFMYEFVFLLHYDQVILPRVWGGTIYFTQ